MTKWLFESWISHFITCLRKGHGVHLTNRHLLVLDGHNLHVTLEVVRIAMESRVGIISLPSHTSHALQPLNVVCFRLFKCAFKEQRNAWTVLNRNKKLGKQDLCEWTSKARQIALIAKKHQIKLQEDRDLAVGPCSCDRGNGAFNGFRRGRRWKQRRRQQPDCCPWHPCWSANGTRGGWWIPSQPQRYQHPWYLE